VRAVYRYIPSKSVVFARSVGPYLESARAAWNVMDGLLDQRGVRRRVRQAYGVFRDNPKTTAAELLRYDACVPASVVAEVEPSSTIGRQTLPGGAFAVHTHIGPFEEIGEALSFLHRHVVPKTALTVDYDRAFMAIYLNDPTITRGIHRRCELCIPVLPVRVPVAGNDVNEWAPDVPIGRANIRA
jgi:AraC family transcriptional regulator